MKTLVAHLGSHKTATTHFQDTLALMSEDLKSLGIKYLTRDFFRPLIPQAILTGKKYRFRRILPNNVNRRHLESFYEKLSDGSDTLFISDENIVGSSYELLDIILYPKFENRTGPLKSIASKFNLNLLISIRCFDKVLPGAYVTDLKYHPQKALVNKQKILNLISDDKLPSWADFIERVTMQFPDVRPVIWTQEFYAEHSNDVIHRVIHNQDCKIPTIKAPEETITPSYYAIKVIESSDYRSTKNWSDYCDKLYKKYPANSSAEKYNFISKEMSLKLKAQYLKDLATIKNNPNVEFLG